MPFFGVSFWRLNDRFRFLFSKLKWALKESVWGWSGSDPFESFVGQNSMHGLKKAFSWNLKWMSHFINEIEKGQNFVNLPILVSKMSLKNENSFINHCQTAKSRLVLTCKRPSCFWELVCLSSVLLRQHLIHFTRTDDVTLKNLRLSVFRSDAVSILYCEEYSCDKN